MTRFLLVCLVISSLAALVAGAPQSFVQNLSQPYYSLRPVVPLPEATAVAPQTYKAALIVGGGRIAGTVTDPSVWRGYKKKYPSSTPNKRRSSPRWTSRFRSCRLM